MTRSASVAVLVAGFCVACGDDAPLGLHDALLSGQKLGPQVVWDPLHKPDPELPFPNDLALHLRADGTTRLNLPTVAPTALERRIRKHLDEVEGFSGLTPITIGFDGPVDLATVTDDTVFVVNIEPGSKRLGEIAALDLGRGFFPHRAQPHAYFPNDPYAQFDSYVLPPANLVDTDKDGKPDQWVYHYEVATNTLDLRPILPLQAGARYAVIVTRKVMGWTKAGEYAPVRSPFGQVNHAAQTEALKRALPALQSRNVQVEDIAFAWTLTTGDLARTFRALRAGLYGNGQFAWLGKQFPPKLFDVHDTGIDFDGDGSYGPNGGKPFPVVPWDHRWVLQGAYLQRVFDFIGGFPQAGDLLPKGAFGHVSHIAFGDFETPNLRATPDNVWLIDVKAGAITADPKQFREKVSWLLTVPKATDKHKPPFPVAIHAHATGTSRIEAVLMADQLAEAGIAVFAIDAVGHGPVLTDPVKMLAGALKTDSGGATTILKTLLGPFLWPDWEERFDKAGSDDAVLEMLLQHGFVQQLAVKGRAVDDDGDCEIKGGEAYYAPDAFRLRDAMRQTTLDNIRAIHVLSGLGKVPKPPDGEPRKLTKAQLLPSLLAGDFDLDGVLDAGGPNVPYFMLGVSLGGIHTALTAPLEPKIVAAAPVVPGAGLADIFIRTKLQGVVTPLMHKVGGVAVVGCPQKDGKVGLSWNDDSDRCGATKRSVWRDPQTGQCRKDVVEVPVAFAQVDVPEGATVVVGNLGNGERSRVVAGPGGAFRAAVASDVGDLISVTVTGKDGKTIAYVTQKTPYEGLGRQRNTPEFRRFVQIAANILEGADAITVADRMNLDPLPGYPAKNLLMMLAVIDQTVPFASGVSLARATGLFGRGDQQAVSAPYRAWTEAAIASGIVAGKDGAVPLLDADKGGGGNGLCRTVATQPSQPGISGLCLADVHGKHEYIAQPADKDSFGAFERGGKAYTGTYTEYHRNLIVSYFHSLGRKVDQDLCWASAKCIEDQKLRDAWSLPVGQAP
jgi:hypothetical protein